MTRILEEEFTSPKSDGSTFIADSDAFLLSAILLAIPIIYGVFFVLFIFFAYKLWLEFGWKIYKKIGADPKIKGTHIF